MTYLGQHFLKNKSAVAAIINALQLQQASHIIEIGPGKGALTFSLLREQSRKQKLVLIEKDVRLLLWLSKKIKFEFPDIKPEYIRGDAVRLLPKIIEKLPKEARYIIVGNVPYSITGALLKTLSRIEKKPVHVVLTIQKEVAKRVSAKAPFMNLLAAITALWASPRIIQHLRPHDFSPAPKVASSTIEFVPLASLYPLEKREMYIRFFKHVFKQPRKTLFNNLRAFEKDEVMLREALKKLTVSKKDRPQDLSIELLIKLADLLI
jgi:16S rRNA (adenine1518-N6/adenine1519-N6)-dimethyltransferase